MERISISDKKMFEPETGEVFFVEVPNKGIDIKVETILCANSDACEECIFNRGELDDLCWRIWCLNGDGSKLTFRRVSDGKI